MVLHSNALEAAVLTMWLHKEDGLLECDDNTQRKKARTHQDEETLTADLANIIQIEEAAFAAINTQHTLQQHTQQHTSRHLTHARSICKALEQGRLRDGYAHSVARTCCTAAAEIAANHIAVFVGTTAGYSEVYRALQSHAQQHIRGTADMVQGSRF